MHVADGNFPFLTELLNGDSGDDLFGFLDGKSGLAAVFQDMRHDLRTVVTEMFFVKGIDGVK